MDQQQNNNSTFGWITMSQAAKLVPYSAEYLSLLARKKKLPAKKINDIWYTTELALQEYVNRQILRHHISGESTNVVSKLPHAPFETAETNKKFVDEIISEKKETNTTES